MNDRDIIYPLETRIDSAVGTIYEPINTLPKVATINAGTDINESTIKYTSRRL